ncbi:hypothetical protein P7M41_26090, partial [Vibrio parahaemolyticus]|nr:hypothetical protein [Vibrio parahaemolyticus]
WMCKTLLDCDPPAGNRCYQGDIKQNSVKTFQVINKCFCNAVWRVTEKPLAHHLLICAQLFSLTTWEKKKKNDTFLDVLE